MWSVSERWVGVLLRVIWVFLGRSRLLSSRVLLKGGLVWGRHCLFLYYFRIFWLILADFFRILTDFSRMLADFMATIASPFIHGDYRVPDYS